MSLATRLEAITACFYDRETKGFPGTATLELGDGLGATFGSVLQE